MTYLETPKSFLPNLHIDLEGSRCQKKGNGNGCCKYGSKHIWISETGTSNFRKYKQNVWNYL
jgi:hypothetical protein